MFDVCKQYSIFYELFQNNNKLSKTCYNQLNVLLYFFSPSLLLLPIAKSQGGHFLWLKYTQDVFGIYIFL